MEINFPPQLICTTDSKATSNNRVCANGEVVSRVREKEFNKLGGNFLVLKSSFRMTQPSRVIYRSLGTRDNPVGPKSARLFDRISIGG